MSFPIFEALMMISFGAAWPFSIRRSYVSGSNAGKSILFLIIIELGYISGIIHKIFWSMDKVIILYIINFFMVSIDVILYFRNSKTDC